MGSSKLRIFRLFRLRARPVSFARRAGESNKVSPCCSSWFNNLADPMHPTLPFPAPKLIGLPKHCSAYGDGTGEFDIVREAATGGKKPCFNVWHVASNALVGAYDRCFSSVGMGALWLVFFQSAIRTSSTIHARALGKHVAVNSRVSTCTHARRMLSTFMFASGGRYDIAFLDRERCSCCYVLRRA